MINKRKVIYFLVVLIASLLFLNIVLSTLDTKKTPLEISMTKKDIDQSFNLILQDFGIAENWIEKKKIRNSKHDSVNYQYRINLPLDIPIPLVIKDVNKTFNSKPVKVSSVELQVSGKSELKIESNKKLKLLAEFSYDKELVRKFSSIGFLLESKDQLSENQIRKIIELNLPVGIILPLNHESLDVAELIKSVGLEYFIELSENTNYVDFELNEELGLDKLSNSIKSIISSFNSPRVFFINELESGFNANIVEFISEKFEDRGRKILTSNNFSRLSGEDNNDLKSLLEFHLNKMKPNQNKIFRINYENWFKIQNELTIHLKKGNKIISPTKIF